MERRVDRLGQRAHGQRFRQTGYAFEEDMSAGEKADQQPVDHVVLSHDASRDLPRDVLNESRIRRGRDLSGHVLYGSWGSYWRIPGPSVVAISCSRGCSALT